MRKERVGRDARNIEEAVSLSRSPLQHQGITGFGERRDSGNRGRRGGEAYRLFSLLVRGAWSGSKRVRGVLCWDAGEYSRVSAVAGILTGMSF